MPVLFFCLVLAAIVAVSSGFAAARAAGEAERSPHELIPLLRDGGLIIYLRHAATDHRESDSDISDLSRCDLQRNLSDQGRQEAAETDKAIRALGIPIGAVYASPYCRTIDTAGLVFGRYEVLDGLRATFFTDAEETARLAAFLRERLSQPRPDGGHVAQVGAVADQDGIAAGGR
ncbi:MAG: histidine phosphatase family protein, partial [Sneathiellaceae bacterium]